MQSVKYLDFELKIGYGKGRRYPVSVIRSPAGEVSGTFHFPFTSREIERFKTTVELAMLRSRRETRRPLSPALRELVGFGVKLFDALFNNSVKACYDGSLRLALGQGRGLRIKLRIEPPELLNLPWEFLYNSEERKFLILSSRTPLVRYIELLHPPMPLSVQHPLRILVVISSPRDNVLLDAEREHRRLDDALGRLVETGLVEIHFLRSPTLNRLQNKLRETSYHILHFIGHGGYDETLDEGFLVLEDGRENGIRVSGANFGRLLSDHVTLRLVVLNACEGARTSSADMGPYDQFPGVAQALIHAGLQAVVAMQFEISDEAAITFAQEFYAAVVDGYPVDAAVAEGRKAIDFTLQDTVEWGTPVLYMRSPDGMIFQMPQQVLEAQLEEELESLYQAALAAMTGRRWADASALLQRIIAHDADFRDVMSRLGEAQRQLAHEVNNSDGADWLSMQLAHMRDSLIRVLLGFWSELSGWRRIRLSSFLAANRAPLGVVATLLFVVVYLASASAERGAADTQPLAFPSTATPLTTAVASMTPAVHTATATVEPVTAGSFEYDVSPFAGAIPSPTAAVTASATATATASRKASVIHTATPTGTATALASRTLTPTTTATPTMRASTPTPTPTVPTATPTPTDVPPTSQPIPATPIPERPTATPVPPTPSPTLPPAQTRSTPTLTPIPPQRATPTPTPDN